MAAGRKGITSLLTSKISSKPLGLNMDEFEDVMLDPDTLVLSKESFYSRDGLEELADNQQLVGSLDPVIVGRVEGVEKVAAGHRRTLAARINKSRGDSRFNLIKCRRKDMTYNMFMLTLLSSNSFNRKLSDWELIEQTKELKKYLYAAQAAGEIEIIGTMRKYIADISGLSETKVAQNEAIDNNLIDEGKEALRRREITFTDAYTASGLPEETQQEIFSEDSRLSGSVSQKIKDERQNTKKTVTSKEINNMSESDITESRLPEQSEYTESPDGSRPISIDDKNTNSESSSQNHTTDIIHFRRCSSEDYDNMISGIKRFDLIKNDEKFKEGHCIEYHEYRNGKETGYMQKAKIIYLLQDCAGLKEGYCIVGLVLL